MILYFHLNLGTSYLNTSSIWYEHLLEKNLPIASCQRWPYKTKLPLRSTDYFTGILVTAAIRLLSQLRLWAQWSMMKLRKRAREPFSQVEYYYTDRHYLLRHLKISVICYHYWVKALWRQQKQTSDSRDSNLRQ